MHAMWFPELWNKLLSFFFPPLCCLCRAPVDNHGSLCPPCWKTMEYVTVPYCGVCSLPLDVALQEVTTCGACLAAPPPFQRTRAVFVYNDACRRLVLRFKDYGATYLARLMATWIYARSRDILESADLLIPVPLHWKKLIKRGYNQSVLVARELSRLSGVPLGLTSLIKKKHNVSQGRLSARQRAQNVRGAYRVRCPEVIQGKHVVLIDDVFSSGSTLKECAQVLRESDAKEVDVLVIARAKLRKSEGWRISSKRKVF